MGAAGPTMGSRMSEASFLRHSGYFAPEDCDRFLNIVGVGATGSWIGMLAARMGFQRFRIWDADKVEPHNLPNQIYGPDDVGLLKVDAFSQALTRFNPHIEIDVHPYFFLPEHKQLLDGPLVITVDTMLARKHLGACFRLNPKIDGVLETRLGFDHAEVNLVDPMQLDQVEAWRASLVNDEDLEEGPCNLRICTTLVTMVAGYAVHLLAAQYHGRRTGSHVDRPNKSLFTLNPGIYARTYAK